MDIIKIENGEADLMLNQREKYLLFNALGGPAFEGTNFRNIPTLTTWTKEEALSFHDKIDAFYESEELEITLTKKELLYLIKVHSDNMVELGLHDYLVITGYTFEEAERILLTLIKIASKIIE